MTRFLSEALKANEPSFRSAINRLEKANQNPAVDIRLSASVKHQAKSKIQQLGLDPDDYTSEELFYALKAQVKKDDKLLVKALRTLAADKVNLEANVIDGMIMAINEMSFDKSCYALKNSSLKSILSAVPPKKTMKKLGFRSSASMLKHDQVQLILAAAWTTEGKKWQKDYLNQYHKLLPKDFETRPLKVITEHSKKWHKLFLDASLKFGHNILTFRELATIIILPLPDDASDGVVTASFYLAISEINDIKSASNYLKLNQLKGNFGNMVLSASNDKLTLNSELLDQPMPWNLVQRYYATLKDHLNNQLFQPYLTGQELFWQPVEEVLISIAPELEFWRGSSHVGVINKDHTVSFNLLDNALNLCNFKDFESRINHYFRKSLFSELLLGYFNEKPVEATIRQEVTNDALLEEVLL